MNKEIEALTNIISIREMLFNELKTVFENDGLNSTEFMIIYMLQHKQKELKSGDLAAALYLPMSTLTGIVDKMEKKGIVIRKHSKGDRRVVVIGLNPEFKEKSEDCMKDFVNLMKEIFYNFTPEWVVDFNERLKSFQEVLEKRVG